MFVFQTVCWSVFLQSGLTVKGLHLHFLAEKLAQYSKLMYFYRSNQFEMFDFDCFRMYLVFKL